MAFQPDGTNAVLAAGQALELDQPHEFVRFRGGRSPRQQRLDKLLSYYDCEQYAARKVAWDGTAHVGQFERDTIALAGYVPPGFYVANSQTVPISFRRPTTPYHLARVIVDRFTSMLFSQRRHPRVNVEADPDTDALLQAVVEEGRLWPTFMQARMFGGATGTAVVGFKVIAGRPNYEVLDPRWCTPTWLDRQNLILKSIEYRYPFVQEVRIEGKWEELEFWFRRIVDMKTDTIYEPEIVDPDAEREPKWKPAQVVEHGLGFCPVVWIQNTPNPTDIDGSPDCLGIYEMVEAIDRLCSQSEKALLANLDPTVVLATDALVGEIRKGSDNALKVLKGDEVKYLEINAAGVTAAMAMIAAYRKNALEVAQCVLDQADTVQRTATEVERAHAPMLAKADVLREQYGEMGIKRLLNMTIVAIKRLQTPTISGGAVTRKTITLPKRIVGTVVTDHKLGPGPYRLAMQWPSYFEASAEDTQKAVNAAVLAKGGMLIDAETAVRYVAANFGVEDVKAMVAKIAAAAGEDQAKLEAMAIAGPKQVVQQMVDPKNEDDTDRR